MACKHQTRKSDPFDAFETAFKVGCEDAVTRQEYDNPFMDRGKRLAYKRGYCYGTHKMRDIIPGEVIREFADNLLKQNEAQKVTEDDKELVIHCEQGQIVFKKSRPQTNDTLPDEPSS